MDRFEQRIAEAVNEKLNDGTVEKYGDKDDVLGTALNTKKTCCKL